MLVTDEVGTCALEEVPVPWDMQVFQQLIPAQCRCVKSSQLQQSRSNLAGQEWDKNTSAV